jgi:hypothetical protein
LSLYLLSAIILANTQPGLYALRLWYISINPKKISVMKYKEMLIATVKDGLEILGYSSSEKMKS